jgi:predicted PurR-regulated permease PerM
LLRDRETRLALKIVIAAAVVILAVWVLIKLAPVISLIVIAVFIVYTINPLVNILIKNNFKPVIAAIISSLLILIAVFLLFYFLIPGLISEMRQLISFLTVEFMHDLPKLAAQLEEIDQRFNLELTTAFIEYSNQFVRQVPGNIQLLLRNLTAISFGVATRIWILLALIFLVFYLVQDLDKARQNLTLLFPQIYKENIVHILGTVDQKVGAYIRGTLMKCLFVGLLIWLGLSLLGMPFSIMLGIIAGIFNIILYIGPFAAAIPALLLSIMPGTPNFFLVVILYLLVQILDAFLFTPLFLGKATDLSPLTVIITVLIGAQLMGILGIILAIPITATLKVLLFHYYLDQRQAEETAHIIPS